MYKSIRDLPVGTLVRDNDSTFYGKPIIWIVLDHDHEGYPKNSTTLLSWKLLTLRAFDAREPNNPDTNRSDYGNSRYIHSNIRQWLNKSGLNWYSKQHTYDAPPNSSLVSVNEYKDKPGFMSDLSADFKKSLLKTQLKSSITRTDGGSPDTFTDTVFLLSRDEVYSNELTNDGVQFNYFSTNSRRMAKVTSECYKNDKMFGSGWGDGVQWKQRLRSSASIVDTTVTYGVDEYGKQMSYTQASDGDYGIRPAVNLDSGVFVHKDPDSNGVYDIAWNQPPTTPEKITVNEPVASNGYVLVQWESSTDPEGDDISYILEKKSNGGEWKQVYQGEYNSNWNWVARTENTVQYRVKAYDIHENESDWITSKVKLVIHNRPPVISGEDKNLGNKEEGFIIKYSVHDPDDSDEVTIVEKLDTNIIREFKAVDNKEYMIDFTGTNWLTVPMGDHVLTINASDSNGATDVRKYTFNKNLNETTVTLSEPLPADDKFTKAIMSITRSIPPEVDFTVEVTNNAFDDEPVWKNVTENVIQSRKIFFENQVATAGKFGFNFKITLKRNSDGEPAYIRSIAGNFE